MIISRATNQPVGLGRAFFSIWPPYRFVIVFLGFTAIGAGIELFAIKTGLYRVIVSNKTSQRYELDKFVRKFRKDMQEWTEEDMRLAGLDVSELPRA